MTDCSIRPRSTTAAPERKAEQPGWVCNSVACFPRGHRDANARRKRVGSSPPENLFLLRYSSDHRHTVVLLHCLMQLPNMTFRTRPGGALAERKYAECPEMSHLGVCVRRTET